MNQQIAHVFWSHADLPSEDADKSPEPIADVQVGDVVIRPDDAGYGIFNYRGDRILDRSFSTATEAERVATDIVAPWEGRVRLDPDGK